MLKLRLDFETFSPVPISWGTRAYLSKAEVLMAAYRLVDGQTKHPIYHWDATVNPVPPVMLMHLLMDPEVTITAFNAPFERLVLREVMGIDLPIERFQCTMVRAYNLGFKGRLHEVGAQMGIAPELIKYHAAGQKCINKFCSPAPANHKADRYDRHSHPELWQEFCEYNVQDIVAEEAVDERCDQYIEAPEWDRQLWVLDQKINDRGVPVDLQAIAGARAIRDAAKIRIAQRITELTGVEKPGSAKPMVAWLLSQGVDVPQKYSKKQKMMVYTLEEDAVLAMLADEVPPVVREVLTLKQSLSKSSAAKYDAFARAEVGGRVHQMFQYGGAQRTKRWAGRVVQLQNLPRPELENPELAIEFVKTGHIDLLEATFGPALPVLSSCLRAVITAEDGKCLNVSDLGSIESRMLGWHSGCRRINETFAQGLDTYREFATHLYNIPYEEVTGKQRFFCKPPTLGCGYRLGADGLIEYAAGMGVTMTKEEAQHAVNVYRNAYPEVVEMWYGLERMLHACVTTGQQQTGFGVRMVLYADMLAIVLPSGRCIHYHQPEIRKVEMPWSTPEKRVFKDSFTCMGENRFTQQWTRLAMHGGWITENIIQASARDIMGTWMLRADAKNFCIVLHAHDEIAAEEENDRLRELQDLIREPIPYTPGLLLDASGYVAKRFRKD